MLSLNNSTRFSFQFCIVGKILKNSQIRFQTFKKKINKPSSHQQINYAIYPKLSALFTKFFYIIIIRKTTNHILPNKERKKPLYMCIKIRKSKRKHPNSEKIREPYIFIYYNP